jgi:hypothetical protein
MSVTAISPVSFVNAPSFVNTEAPQVQRNLQEDTQKAKAEALSDVSSSGSGVAAVQAFMAFPPDVQPIASLIPTNDMPQALPVGSGPSSGDSLPQWSGAIVDVYV